VKSAENPRVQTLDLVQPLDWDTRFWGFPVARVRGDSLTEQGLAMVNQWCRDNGTRCLFFLSRLDDATTTNLAEDYGFRLVDVRMTYVHKGRASILSSDRADSGGIAIRFSRPEDVPALQEIAGDSYQFTRFYYDVNFPRQLCRSLYETWIKVSCEGYADVVLVAALDDQPVGYVSCHIDRAQSSGRIGLVGVSNQAQNRGVGQAMVVKALEWFQTQGAQEVEVTTQGRNCAAQRLYQISGFVTKSVGLWYHKWYVPVELPCE
jgi:dTDP-4-amino-4,6-dideoxy-D-galactose acyltransferase